MKAFSKLLAVLLAMLMLPVVPAFADERPEEMKLGTRGTFYAYVWEETDGAENLYQPFMFEWSGKASDHSIPYKSRTADVAKAMKDYFDGMPDGKRAINPYAARYIIVEDRENYFWYDKGTDKFIDWIQEVLYYYKRLGGKDIDWVTMDFEKYCNVWYLEVEEVLSGKHTWDEVFTQVMNDPRYPVLRQHLIDWDVDMYEGDDHTELYWMHANMNHSVRNDPIMKPVWNGISASDAWVTRYLEEIYQAIKEVYPDINFSDYGRAQVTDPKNNWGGQGINYGMFRNAKPIEERKRTVPGNYMSPNLYGQFTEAAQSILPNGYKYEKFWNTPFHNILFMLRKGQNALMYLPGQLGWAPWVGSYSWSYRNDGSLCATDYYKEFIYHLGLQGADPFLFYNAESGDEGINDNLVFSELLYDLDEVAGFPDKEYIIPEEMTDWNQRYILSGMSAGGRNVWRITPDLTTDDISLESFKIKDNPPTFQIGKHVIEFPGGSFIYESTRNRQYGWLSEAGYWVISPEGTKPNEYIDDSAEDIAEPIYTFGREAEQAARVEAYFERMEGGKKTETEAPLADLSDAFRKLFEKSYRPLYEERKNSAVSK